MLISIVVPCYNMEQYLDETLASVVKQDFQDWECVIVDDGSTDNSAAKASKWTSTDKRFRYFVKQNGGLSSSRNFGIKKARGEVIVPLDADDILHQCFLRRCVDFLIENPEFRIVYSETQLFGDRKELWNDNFDYSEFSRRNLIPCTACFYKKDWEMTDGYDETLKNGFEDWDFWISLVEKGIKVHKIKEPLFLYRQRPDSMARRISNEIANDLRDKIGQKHLEFFSNNLGNPLTMYYQKKEIQRKLELIQNSRTFRMVKSIRRILSYLTSR